MKTNATLTFHFRICNPNTVKINVPVKTRYCYSIPTNRQRQFYYLSKIFLKSKWYKWCENKDVQIFYV